MKKTFRALAAAVLLGVCASLIGCSQPVEEVKPVKALTGPAEPTIGGAANPGGPPPATGAQQRGAPPGK